MKVNAAQHVSGVLTSKQSPRGQAGYQTLFYTHESLTQDEVSVLESQVQNNSARDGKPKWQSYRLNAQRHVISRVIPIAEPDEFGRRGRFFTHSLIFNTPDGHYLDDGLLDLLRPQNFFSSLDAVLAASSLGNGHIQPASADAPREWVHDAESLMREWPIEQLNQLFILMSDPRQLTAQGQYVALIGSEVQILNALKIALLLTPTHARKFCTFDTNVSGSDAPSEIIFWGRGSPSSSGAANYVIDAAQRQVIIPESSSLLAEGFSFEQISMPLRKAIFAQFNRPSGQVLHCLLNRQYAAFIGSLIYQTLLRETDLPLATAELERLTPFGKTHLGLGLLLALKSGNESRRLQALAALKDSLSYKEQVRELSARPDFKPWHVFSPIFMPTWFELFRSDYTLDDLITVVSKVAEYGSTQDREYVATIHEHLDPVERQALGRWLKASSHRFDELQTALDKPVKPGGGSNSAGKSNSFLRRILHPFDK